MQKKNQFYQLSRECIVTALIQLAEQKPFSAITVSELTKRAGVSRMTYYRNYTSKEEVFETYIQKIVDDYRQEVNSSNPPVTYGEYEQIYHCFRYFKKYKDFLSCLMKIGMGNLLLEALSSYLIQTYCPEGRENIWLYYNLQAYAGSLLLVYISWLENDAKEPIEVMTEIIYGQVNAQRRQETEF